MDFNVIDYEKFIVMIHMAISFVENFLLLSFSVV